VENFQQFFAPHPTGQVSLACFLHTLWRKVYSYISYFDIYERIREPVGTEVSLMLPHFFQLGVLGVTVF
jgi:hypothetical protein